MSMLHKCTQHMQLVHLNEKLMAENKKQKCEIELLKYRHNQICAFISARQQEIEMAKKNHATVKLFQAMAAKFKSMQIWYGNPTSFSDGTNTTIRTCTRR